MIKDTVKSLRERMHDQCESHILGNHNPAIVTDVKNALKTLDGLQALLAPTALMIHQALMCSLERPPEEFIERVYSLCCGYTI